MIDSGTATILTGFGALALGQIAATLIWGSAINQRVNVLEKNIEPVIDLRLEVSRLATLIGALDTRLGELNAALNDRPRLPPRRRGSAPID